MAVLIHDFDPNPPAAPTFFAEGPLRLGQVFAGFRLNDVPSRRAVEEVACVRVGHTRVAFEKRPDGSVSFPLVFDEKNPYTLHMQNREVPEVLLYGMHKPRDRASGPAFRDVPWQPAAVAAEWNLLYGCLGFLRDMNIGDPATKDFDGYVAIGGYEAIIRYDPDTSAVLSRTRK